MIELHVVIISIYKKLINKMAQFFKWFYLFFVKKLFFPETETQKQEKQKFLDEFVWPIILPMIVIIYMLVIIFVPTYFMWGRLLTLVLFDLIFGIINNNNEFFLYLLVSTILVIFQVFYFRGDFIQKFAIMKPALLKW